MRFDHRGTDEQKGNPLPKLLASDDAMLELLADNLSQKQLFLLVLKGLRMLARRVK